MTAFKEQRPAFRRSRYKKTPEDEDRKGYFSALYQLSYSPVESGRQESNLEPPPWNGVTLPVRLGKRRELMFADGAGGGCFPRVSELEARCLDVRPRPRRKMAPPCPSLEDEDLRGVPRCLALASGGMNWRPQPLLVGVRG